MILPLTLRASEADRVFSCHGSLTAVPLVPARQDNEGAEGSLLHFLIASRLVLELGAVPPEGGLKAPVLPKGYKLPAFSAWIVDWAVRWVQDNISPNWVLMVEVPVAYAYRLPVATDGIEEFILSGHLDLLAQSPDGKECHGCDWKSGNVGVEPAESNWQVAAYLGLVKRAYPETERAEFSLCQPRIDEEATGIERVSRTALEGGQLDSMNTELAYQMGRALENRFETNSGIRQCRYCPVGWRCPSIQAELQLMKATLTSEVIADLRGKHNDATLADFVISGRTLKVPIEAATDLLHERIDAIGYVDSGNGTRITVKTRPGHYEVPDPVAFMGTLRTLLPEDEQIARVVTPSMTRIKDAVAEVQGIPLKSKVPGKPSADAVFDEKLRPLVVQGVAKILVFT